MPKNGPAKLFLGVAKLFDYSYTASNCSSVVDRVKNLRRSPDAKAKLRERLAGARRPDSSQDTPEL